MRWGDGSRKVVRVLEVPVLALEKKQTKQKKEGKKGKAPKRKNADSESDSKLTPKKARKSEQSNLESFVSPSKSSKNDEMKKKSNKPVLVILPGASGSLTKPFKEILIPRLSTYFTIHTREGKWKSWTLTSKDNVDSVLSVCPKNNQDWYIMGNSFGNRVICAMIKDNLFSIPPKKIFLFGYPMYSDKGTDERVQLLRELPKNTCKILCVSGSNDEFLTRGSGKTAQSVYESIIAKLPCKDNIVLHILQGGKHGVIDVSKTKQEGAVTTVVKWINDFIEN